MTLNESVDRILVEGTTLTDRFYALLFQRHPEAEALFEKTHMSTQAVMLAAAFMVNKFYPDYPLAARQYLNVLGTRHLRAGVPRELYPAFQDVLLVALEEFHGEDWSLVTPMVRGHRARGAVHARRVRPPRPRLRSDVSWPRLRTTKSS